MRQLISAAVISAAPFLASADDFATTRAKLEAAVNSDIRTKREKLRDANRKPIETLAFFGFRDDMKVVELIPGGGWYTKILAPVLHEKGQYLASMNANRVRDQILSLPGFERGKVIQEDARYWRENGDPFLTTDIKTLNIENADMVLTFRNYANFNATGRKDINEEVFTILKPGGIYGVISHTSRHMEPPTHSNSRRFDPVLAIKEITAVGFEFVDYSDLHYRPEDDLTKEVGNKQVTGKTDRWTLKFRKPMNPKPAPVTVPTSQ